MTNIPQPGRTDLCLLRHALGTDVAVVPGSLILDPVNPAPGSTATVKATIENRGDLPVQNVQVVFYDGDPQKGGIPIGDTQTLPGLMGGETQKISVIWNVPILAQSHEVFVVADPTLALDDRDRSNNSTSLATDSLPLGTPPVLVIVDAGVATAANVKLLAQAHFHYLVNDSRRWAQEVAGGVCQG